MSISISEENEVAAVPPNVLLRINQDEALYEELLRPYPTAMGKAASKREREDLNLKETTLVYGEISFRPMAITLEKIKTCYGRPNVGATGPAGIMQHGGIFYDLGSGTGKAVITAAITHEFFACIGIELLEGLYNISMDVLTSYQSKGRSKMAREDDTYCQCLLGDFLNVKFKDWRDGDVVFMNSTCYDDALMQKISRIAVGLKKGAFVITFTKRLPSVDFVVLEHEMHRMSWGEATVYIHQKVTDARELRPDEEEDL